ncbi:circularly permuted type 2 ATP-grasp protein [Coraliomargarita akajimensis]|uniref:circularly permuted type 2 ATP-grasp protein n=1 Tax=Coraliomargarita akajimensis TaxID=395922 RepID=UPI00145E1EF3|nr:circularly permuted type 2 ATP-grasp protein [Coraliomargarita akajimensis]
MTELTDSGALTLPAYKPLMELFAAESHANLARRQKRLTHAIDELGLQFTEMSRSNQNPWRTDLFPLSLSLEEWQGIERGVVQRALAFNAYATDLYSEQLILKQRAIPTDLALRDPAFLRQLSGIEVPFGEYSQFGAFDLVQIEAGDWRVVEHHMGTPFGLSHVLQNRRLLSQAFPELYERMNVAPVAPFSTHLLEMLRAQSSKKNPHILLLTSGQPGQAYFEESLLARHMGLSIAQPGDLLVRDSRVYLKTIRGLEPVDVIYRRVESSALDPIAMPEAGFGGVPGLINVWRQGNVAIVNAPGAGVTDNRSLLRYGDRITKFYLRQNPILKTVETYHLSDVDQRNYVADHLDDMLIKPVQDHDSIWRYCGGKRPGKSARSMHALARRYPEYFVAQALPQALEVPRFRDGRFELKQSYLRVFYILGKEPIVLPGGLCRLSAERHRIRRLSIVTDGLKDVFVPNAAVQHAPPKRRPSEAGAHFSISSRVAESLYWAGRYLERAENTARQFNTLEQLRWDQMAGDEQRTYWPLLQAVAAATGKDTIAKRKSPPSDTLELSKSLLLDESEGASVRACIGFARTSLESVREYLSPESWEVLEDLVSYLQQESRRRVSRSRLTQLSERVVSEVARFGGTIERTMPHDDSWQFIRIGRFIERGMGTMSVLEVALPRIIENYEPLDEESTDLTALLRLLGSLDAYRREFRSRAYIDRVARLVLRGRPIPSSVSYCLCNLRYTISTLSISGERDLGTELLQQIDDLLETLDAFPLAQPQVLDPDLPGGGLWIPEATEVEVQMTELTQQIANFHNRLEDVFFSHQHVFAKDPQLFEDD